MTGLGRSETNLAKSASWSTHRRQGHRRLETLCAPRHCKKEPDWADAGFSLVARVPMMSQDANIQAWTYLSRTQLVGHIERLTAP